MDNKLDIKDRKTYTVKLTRYELLHIRDLMSISLPPEGRQTISQALATLEDRPLVESYLWKKIVVSCSEAKLPTGDEAPDYIIAPSAPPSLGVFQLAHDPLQQEQQINQLPSKEIDHDEIFKGKKEK